MAQERVQSRLGMLFFSQVCLLAAVAGVLAFRHPSPGLVLLGLVWLLDLPRSGTPGRVFLLALAFVGAFAYAGLRTPDAPPVPAWLAENAAPTQMRDGKERPPEALRVRARVINGAPLPGNRLRLVLEQAVPAGDAATAHPPVTETEAGKPVPEVKAGALSIPYQGLISWTWYRPECFPLPGQTIEATLRLSPMRGTKNPGVWDIDRYWQDRNIWFRAWSGAKSDVVILDPDAPGLPSDGATTTVFARMRQNLLDNFLAALPGYKKPTGMALAAPLSEAAAMLPALIFGDRSFINADQTDLVARATLAHSLSLSGLHLGYAVLIGLVLTHLLGRCFPRLWLHVSRPLAAVLLALPLAGIYLWLGQMPLSLMRAACMLLFWTILLLMKRPKMLLDGLLAAVAALMLLDPLSLFDLSLQLSVLSVAALALCLPFISALAYRLFPDPPKFPALAPAGGSLQPDRNFFTTGGPSGLGGVPGRSTTAGSWKRTAMPVLRRFLRWAVTLLGVSFCIQLALMPLTVRAFGAAALCFPLNLIWLPLLGALVMPPAFAGLLLSGLGLELPAKAALYVAALPCDGLMILLRWLDGVGLLLAPLTPRPHWLSIAGFWLLCIALPALILGRGGTRRGTALFVLAGFTMFLLPPALALHASTQPGVRLRLLDVGQGQAALVEWSGLSGSGPGEPSGRALIDGGGLAGDTFDVGKSIVAPALTDNARPRLNVVVNTHPDADHLAGLIYILEHFTVGHYLVNGDRPTPALEKREQAALDRSGLARRTLTAGDRINLAPDLRLEVLWPEAALAREARLPGEEKTNNASLVLRLVWREKGMALLCGDAENPALRAMMDGLRMGEARPAGTHLNGARPEGPPPNTPRQDEPLVAEVLVLPHHGSASSLTPGFYEAVRPKLALASCGYANKWGFPSAEVRSALRALAIPLHDTAESGQIQVEWHEPDGPAQLSLARAEKNAE